MRFWKRRFTSSSSSARSRHQGAALPPGAGLPPPKQHQFPSLLESDLLQVGKMDGSAASTAKPFDGQRPVRRNSLFTRPDVAVESVIRRFSGFGGMLSGRTSERTQRRNRFSDALRDATDATAEHEETRWAEASEKGRTRRARRPHRRLSSEIAGRQDAARSSRMSRWSRRRSSTESYEEDEEAEVRLARRRRFSEALRDANIANHGLYLGHHHHDQRDHDPARSHHIDALENSTDWLHAPRGGQEARSGRDPGRPSRGRRDSVRTEAHLSLRRQSSKLAEELRSGHNSGSPHLDRFDDYDLFDRELEEEYGMAESWGRASRERAPWEERSTAREARETQSRRTLTAPQKDTSLW
jgi:hypothetical protein